MADPGLPVVVRVTAAYRTEYPDPITFHADEEITVSDREFHWDGRDDWVWIWCSDARGKSGWVPRAYIETLDEGRGRGLRDYSAAELTADAGEVLTAEVAEGGWIWCHDAAGRAGWIPLANVEWGQGANINR